MIKHIFILVALYCAVESKTVCYDDLGCFTDDKPFGGTWERPLGFLPESPERVGVKFMLYTRRNPTTAERVMYNTSSTYYDPLKKTKFIVHGFLHNGIKQWVLDMKDALLSVEDMNVIGVDWSKGNGPSYTLATANTQIVGAEIARFVNTQVSKYNAKAADFHVIGHSLGSHIAGYAGERIRDANNQPALGRITGLDPAGPYFENTPPQVRLDPTDAVFVDAIHTDGTANLMLGLGLMQAVAHADFYPNGGKDQPECPKTADKVLGAVFGLITLDVDGIEDSVACSHSAALHFFTDTIINKKCSWQGYECNSESDFNAGKCVKCSGKGCNSMGYWASPDQDQGRLFLNTQPSTGKNFCLQNFGVKLTSGKVQKQDKAYGLWTIQFEGAGGERSSIEIIDDYDVTFKAGSIEQRLVSLKNQFNLQIHRIYISYKRTGNWFTFWWYDSQWNFDSVEVYAGDSQQTRSFCQTELFIQSGTTSLLVPCGNKK